jgi:hypothetical protein
MNDARRDERLDTRRRQVRNYRWVGRFVDAVVWGKQGCEVEIVGTRLLRWYASSSVRFYRSTDKKDSIEVTMRRKSMLK